MLYWATKQLWVRKNIISASGAKKVKGEIDCRAVHDRSEDGKQSSGEDLSPRSFRLSWYISSVGKMPTAVPLTQLVDLALGTPEVGAVNFNVLHTLLHAMINKLGIGEVKAEINDYEREFLATVTNPLGPFLQPTSKHTGSDKDSTFATPPQPTSVNQRATSAVTSDKDSAKGDDSILDDVSETSFVAKTSTYPQSVPYHRLENRVAELSKALADLNALPTTHELFAEIKGQRASEKPVADMWQAMQLKKRVDANEEGIGKVRIKTRPSYIYKKKNWKKSFKLKYY